MLEQIGRVFDVVKSFARAALVFLFSPGSWRAINYMECVRRELWDWGELRRNGLGQIDDGRTRGQRRYAEALVRRAGWKPPSRDAMGLAREIAAWFVGSAAILYVVQRLADLAAELLALVCDRTTLRFALASFVAITGLSFLVIGGTASVPSHFFNYYSVPASSRPVDMREFLRAQRQCDKDSIEDLFFDGSVFMLPSDTELTCKQHDADLSDCRVRSGPYRGEIVVVPSKRISPVSGGQR